MVVEVCHTFLNTLWKRTVPIQLCLKRKARSPNHPSGLFAFCSLPLALSKGRGKKKPGARLHRVGFPYIIS